ncbi:hypothetical protein [Microbacterium sp. YY-01]|uniref:hypothetical protein n=1 Tax=Microbacterium sp. YY-01 TaxID=3421634 RepID=UPI003D175DCD
MKGKIGLVIGLGVGYVLGARAGRRRYEQIKEQWLKVWHLDAVQQQVTKAQDFARAQAAAVPQALWKGTVNVVKAATADGTPGERVDAALEETKDAADTVKKAADETAKASEKKARKDK